ncbi:MAG: glycosyltransferase family 2 protein [Clostridia bacterium]|nr:glycosyltransferase family 2 protein [Clostridia bacterium]
MYKGKRIGGIIIAYNAERTLEDTVASIPPGIIDYLIICDDGSTDRTREIGLFLGIDTFSHEKNKGAGANTARGFDIMLRRGDIDIVALFHGDNQYDPSKLPDVIDPIATGKCDMVLGQRVEWRKGKMPLYKQLGNSFLTAIQNFVFKQNLKDYATGYKAFSIEVLRTINYRQNKNDFEFDPQINVQALMHGFRIMNVQVPTKYFAEASSVTFSKSILYGIQTLKATLAYFLYKKGIRLKRLENFFKKVNNT